jgi:methionine synthase II (cobalamin-independent)
MPIPTELVGSLPRPMKLQEAYADYDEGKISFEQLQASQDVAAWESIKRLEAIGEPYVTDGEQRESSFATYNLTDTLAGTGLADGLAGDGQFFAIFDDGHNRQLPRITKGPFRYKTYAFEFVAKNKAIASHPVKQAVISPSMMMLLYPLDGEIDGYSRDQFLADCIDEAEKDIRQCFDAGAVRVSVDFTEGRLANKNDSRNPWTGKNMLQEFIDLNNRLFDRFTAEERRNIGIHTCPGGDCDSVHSKEVPYELLLSHMFEMNAGYFLIQCASEDDRESIYEMCGKYSREDADGVAQVCFMGVINPLTPDVERPPITSAASCSRPPSTSRWSASARPTTAASRRSAATSSPSTARLTSPATWRCRRSAPGWREPGWPPRSSASNSTASARTGLAREEQRSPGLRAR